MVNRQSSIHQGFTLIELLVVIAIIGIISVSLMTLIDPVAQFRKSNDARRKSDLGQIQKVLEAYYNDNGRYPSSSGYNGWWSDCVGAGGSGGTADVSYRIMRISEGSGCLEWGQEWTEYNTTVPKDPTYSSRKYVYWSPPIPGSDFFGDPKKYNQSYLLYANLERGSGDPQACKNLVNGECPGISSNSITPNSCGMSVKPCNYGVSSPNKSP